MLRLISPTHSEWMCTRMAQERIGAAFWGSLEQSHPAVVDGSACTCGLTRFHGIIRIGHVWMIEHVKLGTHIYSMYILGVHATDELIP